MDVGNQYIEKLGSTRVTNEAIEINALLHN